jgi:arabinogalactan oligomer/maltooligosaccharide transport system substrate-binding protein
MKKYLLVIGVILLTLALTGCRNNDNNGTPTPTPGTNVVTTPGPGTPDAGADYIYFYGLQLPTGPQHLTVWLPYEEFALAMIDSFTARFPNVTIDWEDVGYTDSRDRMLTDGPAGIGGNVFAFPHDQIAFAILDGQIQPVPEGLERKWQSELISTAVNTVIHQGAMHAAPFQVENIALFYNRDLWGPTPPQTWEEVLAFSETWNDPVNHQWTMAWDINVGFFNVFWLTAGGMQLFGPNNDDWRAIGFDTPEAARGLEYFTRMRTLFDIPQAEVNWNTAEERFRLGEIPLTITGPWAINDTLENGVNLGVARIPTIEGRQPYAFSGVQVAAVSTWHNNPWAYAFIDHMVSLEGASILYNYRHMMTTRIDIEAVPGLSDDPFLMGIAEQSPFTVPMPSIAEVQFMWAPLDAMFSFSWDGDLSIAEVQAHAMDIYRNELIGAGRHPDF